jgi:hypothetical protein
MNKDDFTPYDLACIIALHGVFANPNTRVYDHAQVTVEVITQTVDLLFAELAKKKLDEK